jgi:hypothetical protein
MEVLMSERRLIFNPLVARHDVLESDNQNDDSHEVCKRMIKEIPSGANLLNRIRRIDPEAAILALREAPTKFSPNEKREDEVPARLWTLKKCRLVSE